MSRYTAIRTALITSAVLKPLLVAAAYICVASKMDSTYWLVIMTIFLFACLLPGLCVDPAVEEEAAKPGIGAFIAGAIRGGCVFIALLWLFKQPESETFFSAISTRLWDWRPMGAVMVWCVFWLWKDLRLALSFKFSDLYPHLNSMEKSNAR